MNANKRELFRISALALCLLFFLAGIAAEAAETGQPGFIVVGIVPVAQFDAHYAFSTVPTKVMFVDNSIGSAPMTWHWDFGDGTTADEQNPAHTYLRRGTYTVTLTVKNDYGTSTIEKKDFITIGMQPKAAFSASPLSGDAPLTVKFSDESLGQVTRWSWDFGDGKGSSEQSPVHTYWNGGVYRVSLSVSNDYGSADVTRNNYITVVGTLTSAFSPNPPSGKVPLTVKFTDRSIGTPTAWSWDFGDGSTSTAQNPEHVFTKAGSYDVSLTVTRGNIGDSSTQVVNVGGVPITDFNATPRSGHVGEQIRFSDLSQNSPTEWFWDFGDTATSDARNPSHAYQLKGIYTVTLTAKNGNGIDTEIRKDYINIGVGPAADFVPVIIPYQKNAIPMQVQFLDKSANVPTSWEWDFGDGQTSTSQNPKHTYVNEGVYSVTLKAKNEFGEDTMVRSNLIEVNSAPVVDFTADRTTVGVGSRVTFTDLSSNTPTNWVWDFGDGSTGTGSKPDHIYRSTGVYDVTLTASNPEMTNSRTRNQYITVLNIPRAEFTADRTNGGTPLNVNFMDQSAGAPTSWKWDFGDGQTSTDKNPVHRYTSPGRFTVILTVSNANGQDSATREEFIVATPAPVANFKADRQQGKAPFVVRFTDLSTGNPASWDWDFGDGTGSEDQNPNHIYMEEGAYNVRLTVSNEYGSDTVLMTGSGSSSSASQASAGTAATPAVTVTTPVRETTPSTTTANTTATRQSPVCPAIPVAALAFMMYILAVSGRR